MSRKAPAPACDSAQASVVVELSSDQVARVVRAASGSGSLAVLLAGAKDLRRTLAVADEHLQDERLSRSLLYGLLLLAAVPADGSYASVTSIASAVGMSMSTTHRYLSTLVVAGLIERHAATRKYRLANVG